MNSEMQPEAPVPVSSTVVWMVAHTRPRCEKKLVEYCGRLGIETTLPCYQSVRRYRGKKVTFEKPLFPGYVFLQAVTEQRASIYQSDHVANLLDVHDQERFAEQLEDILRALETGLEIVLAPEIGKGSRVKIKYGPLAGMEGWVEERYGPETVLLRLDFIGQAAAVKVPATELEPT
ncbi:MAG TPA: transcription termination/antitermination NusG family protein [Candidatus Limnocylindria bacterium]|nr:transcription termination/antitermination NusG family protein [Candidatus Limnocylindria bacterium]